MKKIVMGVVVLALGIGAYFLFFRSGPAAKGPSYRTATVVRADIVSSVSATGKVTPRNTASGIPVGAQEDAVVGLCHRDAREIAVADADPVAVAHLTQDLQQLRGKDWGDIVQHIQYLLFSRPPVDFGRRTI